MKSSTLRRSNLSKEKMAVLEQLARTQKLKQAEKSGNFQKQNKEKELDVLWQNFRINQKNEKSPGIYLITGFIAGAVAMLIVSTLLSFSINVFNSAPEASFDSPQKVKKESKLTFIPADKPSAEKGLQANETKSAGSQEYTVQSGDTIAAIITKFYGTYDLDKVAKIKAANGMANPDNLQIGQKLIIPME